jgi:anaerobic magnesium-protoporphyrin IX monomethyl ester cyclase
MKALFINPHDLRIPLGRHTWTPLTLVSAAAAMETHGCRVRIFDRMASFHNQKGSLAAVNRSMITEAEAFKPDIILLISNPYTIFDTCRSARDLRRVHEGPLGIFGSQVSALPALTFEKIPQVDLLIEGEPEGPLAGLATEDWGSLPGVWLRDANGGVKPAKPAPSLDMDSLPYPAFHLLDMGYHTKRSTDTIWCHYVSSLTLMTSRGCAGDCRFCLESRRFGSRLRFRSPDLVLSDLERTLKDFKIEAIYFRDCDFMASQQRCREICELIIRRGLHKKMRWAAQVRADSVDDDLVRLMKRAGCTLLEFGIETPRQSHLEALGKNLRVEASQKALQSCRRAGIHSHAYMMMNLLGETMADLEEAEAWVRKHRPSSFFWQRLHVLPGTPLYESHGESFFEKISWDDQQAVIDYIFHRNLGAASYEDQTQWLTERARPLAGRSRRLCQLKANSPWTLVKLASNRLLNRMHNKRVQNHGGADV